MTRSDHNVPDKMDEHYRQQLSAMLDGALSPDEARFLLRRLQHDVELGDYWERWQLCGDILRGQAAVELPEQLLPGDFAAQVAQVIAMNAATPAVNAQPSRWLRWGGGAALAASVAVVALMAVRQSPEAIHRMRRLRWKWHRLRSDRCRLQCPGRLRHRRPWLR